MVGILLLFSLIVRDVNVEGNKHIGRKRIEKVIVVSPLEEYDSLKVKESKENIEYLYRTKGYIYAEVNPLLKIDGDSVDVIFHIKEERRIVIRSITMDIRESQEEIVIPVSALPADFRVNKPLNPERIPVMDSTIKYIMADMGYPYAEINITVNIKGRWSYIIVHISPGKKTYMKCKDIVGLKKVERDKVESIISLKTPVLFSFSYLNYKKQMLYQTEMFRTVFYKVHGFEAEKDTVDVVFYLEEFPPRVFSTGIGYQIPDRFLLSLSWDNMNVMHRLHTLGLSVDWSQKLDGTFSTEISPHYNIIYLYSKPFNFNLSTFLNYDYERIYRQIARGARVSLEYLAIYPFNIFSSITHESIKKEYEPEGYYPEINRKTTTSILESGINLDSRKNPVDPYQGIYLLMSGEIAVPLLGGTEKFMKLTNEIKVYIPFKYGVMAFRTKWGGIMGYGESSYISTYYMFTLGGDGTIRGYDEKSIGPLEEGEYHYGNFLFLTNIEYRSHYIWKYLYGVIFMDFGSIDSDLTELFTEYTGLSAGSGLRYTTPLGPIRIDYAYPLMNESGIGKIYIGILHAF